MKQKAKSNSNIVIAIITVLLIAALVWLIIAEVKHTNAICLFGHNYDEAGKCTRCGESKIVDEPTDEKVQSNVVITPTIAEGIRLFSEPVVTADNPDTYTLTATLSPAQVEEIFVDWTVEFVDPESDWATDKTVTDYVTVTPASDGALTATVECLQAFGSQIQVVVTVRDFENLTAKCNVDYKAKPVKVISRYYVSNRLGKFGYDDGGTSDVVIFDLSNLSSNNISLINSTPTNLIGVPMSTGTIVETPSIKYSLCISYAKKSQLNQYFTTGSSYFNKVFINRITNENYNSKVNGVLPEEWTIDTVKGTNGSFALSFDNYQANGVMFPYLGIIFPGVLNENTTPGATLSSDCTMCRQYLLSAFARFYAANSISQEDKYNFTIKIEVTLGEDTYIFERKVLVKYEVPVTGVSLNQSSLVF